MATPLLDDGSVPLVGDWSLGGKVLINANRIEAKGGKALQLRAASGNKVTLEDSAGTNLLEAQSSEVSILKALEMGSNNIHMNAQQELAIGVQVGANIVDDSSGKGTQVGEGFINMKGSVMMRLNFAQAGSVEGALIQFFRQGVNVGEIGKLANQNKVSYIESSDYRLKENVRSLDNAIDLLLQLRPRAFSWVGCDPDVRNMGFIAHEVQELLPGLVSGKKDGMTQETETYIDETGVKLTRTVEKRCYQGLSYSNFMPLLTAALQEAIDRIASLEEKVQQLSEPRAVA